MKRRKSVRRKSVRRKTYRRKTYRRKTYRRKNKRSRRKTYSRKNKRTNRKKVQRGGAEKRRGVHPPLTHTKMHSKDDLERWALPIDFRIVKCSGFGCIERGRGMKGANQPEGSCYFSHTPGEQSHYKKVYNERKAEHEEKAAKKAANKAEKIAAKAATMMSSLSAKAASLMPSGSGAGGQTQEAPPSGFWASKEELEKADAIKQYTLRKEESSILNAVKNTEGIAATPEQPLYHDIEDITPIVAYLTRLQLSSENVAPEFLGRFNNVGELRQFSRDNYRSDFIAQMREFIPKTENRAKIIGYLKLYELNRGV